MTITSPSSIAADGLAQALAMIGEDTIFAIACSTVIDTDAWRPLADRRADAYARQARGEPVARPGVAPDSWLAEMCRAAASAAPPPWLPMGEVVARGVTLEGGARGARALFTSKPSDKDVSRVRRLGGLALRAVSAVMAADGPFTAEEERLRACLVASFGLDDIDARALLAEPPTPATAIDIYGDLDPKLALALVRGAWAAGAQDGLAASEEEAVAVIANKAGVTMQAAADLRNEARADVESRFALGRLGVDLVRLVLGDDPALGQHLAALVAEVCVPVLHRADVLEAARRGATVTLTDRGALDRRRKAAGLGFAWAACLASNPSIVRRVELAARHDLAAAQLGELADAPRVRSLLDDFVESNLAAAATTSQKR